MTGFRLISIEIKENDEIDEGLFVFNNEEENTNKNPYTTLIIGPNGTGKSRILKIILDIFNDLITFQTTEKLDLRFNKFTKIVYRYNNTVYSIINQGTKLDYYKNENTILNSIFEIELPSKVIVASYSIYEKFTPKTVETSKQNSRKTRYDNDYYEYLGVKTSSNFTFTASYINRSIDLLTSELSEFGFTKDIKKIFDTLEFTPAITVTYKVSKNKELYSGNLNIKILRGILEKSTYRNTGFSYNSIQNILDSDEQFIEQVAYSLNSVAQRLNKFKTCTIDFSFNDLNDNLFFTDQYQHFALLRKLNLINYSRILVYKKTKNSPHGQGIDIKQMSSGEIQVLTSMLSLSAVVRDNSLVLIDEPEISLHPNWQMKYIDILNSVFKKYSNCHFIIASHSHFMVSDLKPESSSILSLTRDKEKNLVAENIDYSTYGWSAENILYNVFNVATVRNYYFEMDLRSLLSLISKQSNNYKKIDSLIEKLSIFKLHPNDPLNLILQDAKEYVSNRK